ncbi:MULTISPECIES: thermonuclease family protein [Flavobacterium]|uniref:thermonuclease family protein n=1 Tax=Flavobacterium TaxID=237 RepID=UPI001FCAE1E4|nr:MULTISPECIES: thermonuclease family protein [Flavobacterium]UOK43400.1 thermonuclease family protein [Flavobacterium enshiense]
MKKTFLLLTLLFCCFFSYSQTYFTGKVIAIKDGDTVVVLDSLNKQTTLRLAEIDCPEKNQPFGTKAKQFTSQEIFSKTIRYKVYDVDRYGRTVAQVYYDDNKYLSAEIIKHGMGWHYKKYSTSKELAQLEITARKNKTGLWIDTNPIEPSQWRKK